MFHNIVSETMHLEVDYDQVLQPGKQSVHLAEMQDSPSTWLW